MAELGGLDAMLTIRLPQVGKSASLCRDFFLRGCSTTRSQGRMGLKKP